MKSRICLTCHIPLTGSLQQKRCHPCAKAHERTRHAQLQREKNSKKAASSAWPATRERIKAAYAVPGYGANGGGVSVAAEGSFEMTTGEEVRPRSVLYCGDCLEVLKQLQACSVDSIVTDPPAGIDFMGKDWDKDKGGRDKWIEWMTAVAIECRRILKPGGHALVWSFPRTSHWTATAWENAGFEVRDRVAHIFGSGFPKSHDIANGIDKHFNLKPVRTGKRRVAADGTPIHKNGSDKQHEGYARPWMDKPDEEKNTLWETASATAEAQEWDGWGTALKPAIEDWWLFRKPCAESTVAANVLKYGTGALNIDACRVPGEPVPVNKLEAWSGFGQLEKPEYSQEINDKGRWPANLVHDGSECVIDEFPLLPASKAAKRGNGIGNGYGNEKIADWNTIRGHSDSGGSAARFFYCAKPDQQERNFGLRNMPKKQYSSDGRAVAIENPYQRNESVAKNFHPTVKAQALMIWLIKLITPPGGMVLDTFMGSGSTGVACVGLGHPFIGIEQDPEYMEIAKMRILSAQAPLFVESL